MDCFACLNHSSVVVCNQITGEFIHLPEVFKLENVKGSIDCGFGQSED